MPGNDFWTAVDHSTLFLVPEKTVQKKIAREAFVLVLSPQFYVLVMHTIGCTASAFSIQLRFVCFEHY